MVGAYGNIGGLILSSILYFTISPTHKIGDVPLLFLMIAGSALVMAILCRLLPNDDPVVLEEEAMLVLADAELAVRAGAVVR